jgi:N-formylglutamate amidohydrolase
MRLFLVFAPPLEEARLRLNGLYNPRLENMEKAVFRQKEEHGARIFLNVEHHFHSSHQKVS